MFYNLLYKGWFRMNKRSIFVLIALVILLIIIGCNFEESEKLTDSQRFKEEYESINGNVIDGTNYKVRSISISDDNPIVYAEANDIISMMDNNETFVVYFGFSTCPWCRSVLPILLDVAHDLKIKKIYYVDVKEIRDVLTVSEDGNIITKKEGSEGYIGLLNRLGGVLDDYTLEFNGKKIKTGEKRIYAPNVVSVVNGEAKEIETGIVDTLVDPYMEITEEIRKETYNKFECSIKCVLENKNSCSSKHAC